jgi:hypothetical protein
MIGSFVDLFFGCSHKRTSFPITPARSSSGIARGGTYVACLDCGKEFAYDWKTMQMGEQVATRASGPAVVARRPA